jgi:hypothetical protein
MWAGDGGHLVPKQAIGCLSLPSMIRFFCRGVMFVRRNAAQVLNSLGVNMNFGNGIESESLQLFDDASLGTVAAVQKGRNYRKAH